MTQHPLRHARADRARRVPVTLLLLMTSATSIVTCQETSSSPFQPTRKSRLMPINFRPQYTQIYQVEKLKAQILRSLNMTAVPLPPTKPPKPITRIENRLPVPVKLTDPTVLPGAIVWSEPVDSKHGINDQLLFRVSNQKNKSAVINRVSLVLRLRSKQNPKKKVRNAKPSPSKKRKNKKRKASKSKLPDVKGSGFQGDDQSSGRSGLSSASDRKSTSSKSKRKKRKQRKKPQVKVLVQAVNEKSGKFKRVVVQRFAINKKFNWIHLPIPASLVSRAAQSTNQTLVLRVRCKRCYKQKVFIDSTLPRRKRRRRKNRDGKVTSSGTASKSNPAARGAGGTNITTTTTTTTTSTTTSSSSSSSVVLNPNRPYLLIRTADAPLATKAPPTQRQRSARHVDSQFRGDNGGGGRAGSLCPGSGRQPWLTSASESGSPATCCAESLRVDFKDLGWDHWVVYPPGFTTVVCRGGCGRSSSISSGDPSHKNGADSVFQTKDAPLPRDIIPSSFTGHRAVIASSSDGDKQWYRPRLRRNEDEPHGEAEVTSSLRQRVSETSRDGHPGSRRGIWDRPPNRNVNQPKNDSRCVPQDRSPLEVMYYADPNTLIRAVIPNLVSRSCGCLPD